MVCAATNTASVTKATARPIPIPNAASEIIHTASSPADASPPTCGHWGNRARVTLTERTTRARSAPDFMPGSGRNTNTPPIRASVSKKPSRVAMESCSSPCIAAQVPQDPYGVRHELLEHPGQRQNEGRQESHQARNGVEPAVLDGSDNLD